MGIFPLFKPTPFLSAEQQQEVVAAIQQAEQQTSGEIRVYIESKNYLVDPLERAKEIFFQLKMDNTVHRNAVLVYLATKHKELALFADEGIYNKTGPDYWKNAATEITAAFADNEPGNGLVHTISSIGQTLKEYFPYQPNEDKNELPDTIVFGK